ncbi:MAG: DUF1641 domain-containing protein [bacterium]
MENTRIPETNGSINKDVKQLTTAITDSITPAMINRLTENIDQIGRLSEMLTNAEIVNLIEKITNMSESLNLLLDILKQLHEQGTLDQLANMVGVLDGLLNSLTPGILSRMVDIGLQLVEVGDFLLTSGLHSRLPFVIHAIDAAIVEAQDKAGKGKQLGGIIGLLRALKQPEIQEGLQILLKGIRGLSTEEI